MGIYCKYEISEQKRIHENVHMRQQLRMGVKEWWNKYLEDIDFRREQELEAYKKEVDWVMKRYKGFKHRMDIFERIVQDISSSIYGNMITEEKARELLLPDMRQIIR